ncbi:MAG: hypothetical protein GYA36_13895 [Veillonellaceae bacterium]|nr:hypothetical protein [Veillonellaceae bacterium]
MKLLRTAVLLSTFFFLFAGATALAAPFERWVTDSASGGRICIMVWDESIKVMSASWSGPLVDGKAEGKGTLNYAYREKDGKETKGQADAEMKAGKLDGYVSMKWSDGETYDGFYKDGLREGKGTFKYADGRVYEGDWKGSKQNGYGVGKSADGKVLHDGQWKDGNPVVVLKTDKVLGISWEATADEAKSVMRQRPNTSFMGVDKRYPEPPLVYGTKYNTIDAVAHVYFYQGKMFEVEVFLYTTDDEVMKMFESMKKGLAERYGKPFSEAGKYLDSQAAFDLGNFHTVSIRIGTYSYYEVKSSYRSVIIDYYYTPTAQLVQGKYQKNNKSDF